MTEKFNRDNHWTRTENDFYHETIKKHQQHTTKKRSDVQKVTSYLLRMIHRLQ